MVDASREYVKDGNKNRLRSRDIHKIVDVFNHQKEVPCYSRLVSLIEIASESNGYNLNIPRYIDAGEREDLHDLDAHLNGGIPQRDVEALKPYWSVLPDLREVLFQDSGRPGDLEAKVETQQVTNLPLSNGFRISIPPRRASPRWCQVALTASRQQSPGLPLLTRPRSGRNRLAAPWSRQRAHRSW